MRTILALLTVTVLTGCSFVTSFLQDPITIKVASQLATRQAAVTAKVNKTKASTIISHLNIVEQALPAALPPDFGEARKLVNARTSGDERLVLQLVINLTEQYASDYLKNKESGKQQADLKELRAIMQAVIAGAKEGLESVSS